MKLPVYLYGHPVLRRESEPIDKTYPELSKLIDDMWACMYESEGVGLAAPQIGRNIKLIVIDASPVGDDFPECAGRKLTLINPELEVLDGEREVRSEGCLSLPGLSENVPRVEHIRLRWLDENFEPHEEEMSGFLARIVQHEYDHLIGKLYIDHISPIRKQLIKGKLNNIISGKTRCNYPVKYAPKKK
ncbi:MAG: peptide deformylase [Muribaculaceae bacterium]|nr:peptide deformylase [Muribaculaceae bacterium]MDE5595278.1 peptide deformylase [Muribaculaceae bacterium]MDE6703022.1 peptide deformylase [Muribaculaceae bacterium]